MPLECRLFVERLLNDDEDDDDVYSRTSTHKNRTVYIYTCICMRARACSRNRRGRKREREEWRTRRQGEPRKSPAARCFPLRRRLSNVSRAAAAEQPASERASAGARAGGPLGRVRSGAGGGSATTASARGARWVGLAIVQRQ